MKSMCTFVNAGSHDEGQHSDQLIDKAKFLALCSISHHLLGHTFCMSSLLPATTPAMMSECPFRYLVALSITTSMPKSAGLSVQQQHQSTHSLSNRLRHDNCTVYCIHSASAQTSQGNVMGSLKGACLMTAGLANVLSMTLVKFLS